MPPPSTSTSILSQGSTVAPPTTGDQTPTTSSSNADTPVTAGGGPSGPGTGNGSSTSTERLPFTGINGVGPLLGAGSLVLGGIAVAFGSRKRRNTV
jgi:hypothetical protein